MTNVSDVSVKDETSAELAAADSNLVLLLLIVQVNCQVLDHLLLLLRFLSALGEMRCTCSICVSRPMTRWMMPSSTSSNCVLSSISPYWYFLTMLTIRSMKVMLSNMFDI